MHAFKILICALGLAASVTAQATSLSPLKGEPILEVTGNISVEGAKGSIEFDREKLESLGLKEIVTTTPWHSGAVRFEGVPLDRLMSAVGAQGTAAKITALNDYSSTIPVEDFAKYGVILAIKKDGEYMPIRDKGPLFIIYPYDSMPELKSQKFYARSVWQVKRIEIQK